MSSFPAQAARVRDASLPVQRRLLALRECLLHFAPYGFRATWHHLVVSADIPVWLEDDPDSLLRAIDELEPARRLWLAEVSSYAAARRLEKVAGRRTPRRSESWHLSASWLAFCPDPEVHPTEPLATVLERLLTAYRSTARPEGRPCPACAEPARPEVGAVCRGCGIWRWDPSVFPWHRAGPRPPGPPRGSRPWPLIWHRAVPRRTTVGGGDVHTLRVEYTPTTWDPRFGAFQMYVDGVALSEAATTALEPHFYDLMALDAQARRPGVRGPVHLPLGDTFDHLDVTLETTEHDLVFTVETQPDWWMPPPWAPRIGSRLRLRVRRTQFTDAWQDAEPALRRFLAPGSDGTATGAG